jgi:hypothetical protein
MLEKTCPRLAGALVAAFVLLAVACCHALGEDDPGPASLFFDREGIARLESDARLTPAQGVASIVSGEKAPNSTKPT